MISSFIIRPISVIPFILRSVVISGIRLILSESISLGPASFQVEVIQSTISHRIASYDFLKYTSSTPPPFVFARNSIASDHYQLHFQNFNPAMMAIAEIRLLVCVMNVPSEIVFTPNEVEVITDVDSLRISPTGDVMNCTIIPPLPASLSLNYETCTVRGIVHEIMNQTFTVTAHMQATIEGSFTIRSYACNQSLFRMYRRWGESPFGETARIVSIETKEVIYSEEANSFQQPNQLVITSFCFSYIQVFLGCKLHSLYSSDSSFWGRIASLSHSFRCSVIISRRERISYTQNPSRTDRMALSFWECSR